MEILHISSGVVLFADLMACGEKRGLNVIPKEPRAFFSSQRMMEWQLCGRRWLNWMFASRIG